MDCTWEKVEMEGQNRELRPKDQIRCDCDMSQVIMLRLAEVYARLIF